MNERRVRYITLIAISLVTLLAFFIFAVVFLRYDILLLSNRGSELPMEILVILLCFLGIGTLVIVSSFYKTAFYTLSIFEIILTVAIPLVEENFFLYVPFLRVVQSLSLIPLVFYYGVRVIRTFRLKALRK